MVTHHYDTDYPLVVGGHKLRIGWVKVDPAGHWHEKDRLAVWLELEEAVGSNLAFAVYLPVTYYTRVEFLALVGVEIEKAFKGFIKKEQEDRERDEQRRLKENSLNSYAEEIQAMLKGEPIPEK